MVWYFVGVSESRTASGAKAYPNVPLPSAVQMPCPWAAFVYAQCPGKRVKDTVLPRLHQNGLTIETPVVGLP